MFAPVRKRRMTYSTSSGEGIIKDNMSEELQQQTKAARESISQESYKESVCEEDGYEEEVWEREGDQPPLNGSNLEQVRLLKESNEPLQGSESDCSSDSDSDSSSTDSSSSQGDKHETDSCASNNKNETIELKPYCSDIEEFDTGTESDDDKLLLMNTDNTSSPMVTKTDTVGHASNSPVPKSNSSDSAHSLNIDQASPLEDKSRDPISESSSLLFPSVGTTPSNIANVPININPSIATPPLITSLPPVMSSLNPLTTPPNTGSTPLTMPPNIGPSPSYNQLLSSYMPQFYPSPSQRPNPNVAFPYNTTSTPPLYPSPYPASVAMLQYMQYMQQQHLLRGVTTPNSSNVQRPFHLMSNPQYQQQLLFSSQLNNRFMSHPRYQLPPRQTTSQSNETTNVITMTTDVSPNTEQSHVPKTSI